MVVNPTPLIVYVPIAALKGSKHKVVEWSGNPAHVLQNLNSRPPHTQRDALSSGAVSLGIMRDRF